jgi:hypothetical protein
MLRADLEAAGIPYAVEGPDGPLYADFHSLRHSYLTLGGRAGIELRTLQELAGHSTPTLTARYSHRRLHDLAGAVEKLPNFLPTDPGETETGRLAATGTEGPASLVAHGMSNQPPAEVPGAGANGPDFGCTLVAHRVSNQGHPVASAGSDGEGQTSAPKQHNPLIGQQVAATVISGHQAGELGFEPGTLCSA